jgi:hypothetical protein
MTGKDLEGLAGDVEGGRVGAGVALHVEDEGEFTGIGVCI